MRTVQTIRNSFRSLTGKARPVFLFLAVAALAQTAVAQQYQLNFLDDLGGNSRGNSINNRSWVAGFIVRDSKTSCCVMARWCDT